MKREHYITASEFCSVHNIEMAFLYTLNENGFINLDTEKDNIYIYEDELPWLEKIVTFYYELGINLEGIETIINLLARADQLQEEINILKNRLNFYESI